MAEYVEKKGSLDIPKNVGVEGFLVALRDILRLPRVQHVELDARGRVNYRYYVREGQEALPLEVDFSTVTPYAVVRNGEVTELPQPDGNAAVAFAQLTAMAAVDHLFPCAVVAGTQSTFWAWFESSTRVVLPSREELFGMPFLTDRMVDDETLLLCAGFSRRGALLDTQKSYRLLIPKIYP